MRRKDREKSEQWARALLARAEYATLSMVGEGGAPYSVPISPVMIDGNLYVHCAAQGRKIDYILREGRVCVSCVGKTRVVPEKTTTAYESAIATGRAHMVQSSEEKTKALFALCEKYAPSLTREAVSGIIEKQLARTAVVCVELEEVTGKENRQGERD